MATPPRTLGSGASNGPGQDRQKADHGTVAEEMDSFDEDLSNGHRAGRDGKAPEARYYTAFDVKSLHGQLPDFTNAELSAIPILAHGESLEQGGVYLDLSDRQAGAFTAQGGTMAEDPHLYVPKALCDYLLWNRLTGTDEQR